MRYRVTLNGRTYEVEVDAGEAMLIDEYEAAAPVPAVSEAPAAAPAVSQETPAAVQPAAAPAPAPAAGSGEPIDSPMPGKIVDVRVSDGQAVKAGEVLIVLEAMKMENEITAPRDCTITQVSVSKGASVETGTPLVYIS